MRSRGILGPAIGLLTVAVALGIGELAAAFVRPAAAPVIAVGNRLILLTPESAKREGIRAAGTNDKLFLVIGIYFALAVFGMFVGRLALRRLWSGLAAVAAFGAFGAYCALTADAARASDVVPSIIAALAAMAALALLVRSSGVTHPGGGEPGGGTAAGGGNPATAAGGGPAAGIAAPPSPADRRTFLQAGVASAAVAAAAGFGGRAAADARFDVAAQRSKITLPPVRGSGAGTSSGAAPSAAPTTAPPGTDLGRSGVPWATSNGDFYRIDTALSVPQVDPDHWQLRVHGMVDREMTLSYAQLLRRPLIERWVTLCCVSNEVGGNLVGNALFRGTRLADLLREAGLSPQADQLVLTSVDGMTIGAPAAVVMDGRDAMLAVGMNGQPLPVEHGFPVRTVVPGLYGYVSACKWIVDIEATTFAQRQAYWVQGGWAPRPPIQLESRIDRPGGGTSLRAGTPVAVAGVAWDQHVGVSKVELSVNGGPWLPARLASVPSTDTWRQWVVSWTPPRPGSYRLQVRATDARGRVQTAQTADPFPSGATGLHTVTVHAGS